MADFITLTCSSCGGKLQINKQIEQFSCARCGSEFIVNRSGGIVSIAPVIEGLKEVKVGVDKTASELAITRLRQEITVLEKALRDTKASEGDEIRSGFGMGVFGILIIIFGLWVSGGDAPLICIGAFILISIMGFVTAFQGLAGKNQGKIKQISNELAKKRMELQHHQGIVNKI